MIRHIYSKARRKIIIFITQFIPFTGEIIILIFLFSNIGIDFYFIRISKHINKF